MKQRKPLNRLGGVSTDVPFTSSHFRSVMSVVFLLDSKVEVTVYIRPVF